MKTFPFRQTTFLLRVWRSNSDWRISLEDPMTGERNGFSDLEAFLEFLRDDTEPPPRNGEEDGTPLTSNS